MSDQTELSVIRRKAGGGRPPSEGATMTPAKAFRFALSKSAESELHLAVKVLGVKEERLPLSLLLQRLGADDLIIELEGVGDSKGVATFDPQFLAAVIEVQTTGRVASKEAAPRRTTRTDSMMCETVLDRAMQEFEGHLAGLMAANWATGYRFRTRVETPRLLGLALADISYRFFRISLDLADGAKQGELVVALPEDGGYVAHNGTADSEIWAKSLENAVYASQAEILAVLHRLQVPVAAAKALKVDDVLTIPQSAISAVVMETLEGAAVGQARLGQQNGFKALRISADTVPALLDAQDPPPAPQLGMDGAAVDSPDMALAAAQPEAQEPMPMMPTQAAPMEFENEPAPMGAGAEPVAMEGLEMATMAEDAGEMPMATIPMDIEIN